MQERGTTANSLPHLELNSSLTRLKLSQVILSQLHSSSGNICSCKQQIWPDKVCAGCCCLLNRLQLQTGVPAFSPGGNYGLRPSEIQVPAAEAIQTALEAVLQRQPVKAATSAPAHLQFFLLFNKPPEPDESESPPRLYPGRWVHRCGTITSAH